MSVRERFDELLKKREEAKRNKVQLETRIEASKESMKAIEEEWQEKWGVSTLEEVKSKLAEMEAEVESTLAKCEEFLKEAGV